MGRRLRLGRIFDVEVSVDWTWIITFVLAAWTLVVAMSRLLPALGLVPLVAAGVAAAGALFFSLVLHELIHGIVARACGVPVRHVTLFLVGGVTDIERSPTSPRVEVLAALASPLTNLGIGAVLALSLAVAYGPLPRGFDDLDRFGAPGVVIAWAAIANAGVFALNMLPAYPLDGGRLVRAAIWRVTGDVGRATRWAAWGGQVIGWLVVVLGVAIVFAGTGASVAAGMWTAFVGWFVASSAAQGYEDVVVQDALSGISVGRVMRRSVVAVPGDLTVTTAMRTYLSRSDGRPMPVVDGAELVGLVSFRDVRELPAERWRSTLVRELAASHPATTVTPQEPVLDVLTMLGDVTAERLPVVEGRRLVGMLDRHDVMRWIEARAETKPMQRREAQ